jgi:hypothetical protein
MVLNKHSLLEIILPKYNLGRRKKLDQKLTGQTFIPSTTWEGEEIILEYF